MMEPAVCCVILKQTDCSLKIEDAKFDISLHFIYACVIIRPVNFRVWRSW